VKIGTNVILLYSTTYDINDLPEGRDVTGLDRRIRRLAQNPKGVSSAELISVLVSVGFEERGGKGSHRCFRHPKVPGVFLTVPKQNPLGRAYVVHALNAINRVLEQLENEEQEH